MFLARCNRLALHIAIRRWHSGFYGSFPHASFPFQHLLRSQNLRTCSTLFCTVHPSPFRHLFPAINFDTHCILFHRVNLTISVQSRNCLNPYKMPCIFYDSRNAVIPVLPFSDPLLHDSFAREPSILQSTVPVIRPPRKSLASTLVYSIPSSGNNIMTPASQPKQSIFQNAQFTLIQTQQLLQIICTVLTSIQDQTTTESFHSAFSYTNILSFRNQIYFTLLICHRVKKILRPPSDNPTLRIFLLLALLPSSRN